MKEKENRFLSRLAFFFRSSLRSLFSFFFSIASFLINVQLKVHAESAPPHCAASLCFQFSSAVLHPPQNAVLANCTSNPNYRRTDARKAEGGPPFSLDSLFSVCFFCIAVLTMIHFTFRFLFFFRVCVSLFICPSCSKSGRQARKTSFW